MKIMTDLSALPLRRQNSKVTTLFGSSLAKFVALAMVGLSLAGPVPLQAAPLPGAIFTTDSTCTGGNINIYSNKDAVYLDGGPAHPGAAGLPGGTYYVKVTEPDGTLLGTSVGSLVPMPFEVDVNGEPLSCYQLSAILIKASDQLPGYDTTSNPGGEYKVWVSTDPDFVESQSKTDNFKVKSGEVVIPIARLDVEKFYDANVNGKPDAGELLITGWKILIQDGISLTRFTPVSVTVEATNPVTNTPLYNVFEYSAVEDNWIHTTQQTVSEIALTPNETTTVMFGNVCIGPGGGKTLGFWSNKNGQLLIGDDDIFMLKSLNLRNAGGTEFNPDDKVAFRTWLLSANATNMAYMLSAQLAAMELNVFNENVKDESALIYSPQLLMFPEMCSGDEGLNGLGFISIRNLMDAANASLGSNSETYAGVECRAYQEALKNALDKANNNKNFVQATPCPFTFSE